MTNAESRAGRSDGKGLEWGEAAQPAGSVPVRSPTRTHTPAPSSGFGSAPTGWFMQQNHLPRCCLLAAAPVGGPSLHSRDTHS